LSYAADAASLDKLRQAANLGVADMVFLALDYSAAMIARPYLGGIRAIYATSQVNVGNSLLGARELDQVRFVDLPWLLQPQHAPVMIYPHPGFASIDLDRLYALGIDAFRVCLELLRQNRNVELDGVTGRIRITADLHIDRDLVDAQYVDGKALVSGEAR